MREKKYTTIPVLVNVKEQLDSIRGGIEWSEFLIKLVEENKKLKRILAAKSIQERFNADIEKNVKESIEHMRGLSLVETK